MGLSMIDAITDQLKPRLPDTRYSDVDSCVVPYTLPPEVLRFIFTSAERFDAFNRSLCYALQNLGCRTSVPALQQTQMLTKVEYETISVLIPHLAPILYSITDVLDLAWAKLTDIRYLGPDIYLYFT